MKKLIVLTFLLSACGGDIKSKDKNAPANNGIVINNGIGPNNGASNNGSNNETNNGVTNNITTPINNNTTPTNNNTVPALCGNGTLDTTEECEGFEFRGKTCESEGFVGGTILCDETCKISISECETCGDGVIDPGEECDGNDFGGATCTSENPTQVGQLDCNADCTFDKEECVEGIATCSGFLECLQACPGGDERCQQVCAERTPQPVIQLYIDVANCAQNNGCQDQTCILEQCGREYDACINN